MRDLTCLALEKTKKKKDKGGERYSLTVKKELVGAAGSQVDGRDREGVTLNLKVLHVGLSRQNVRKDRYVLSPRRRANEAEGKSSKGMEQ